MSVFVLTKEGERDGVKNVSGRKKVGENGGKKGMEKEMEKEEKRRGGER